ncbi:serine protease persephone-like [Anoplophora glabripennis]|uniref:serine protease persephone-like n=1 Tax=Anoplophora glabripennis TaxID=217634 RepID=UPI0008755EBB|nr:serine protease persephone-like [Anoplophora glabripennis]
MLCIRFSYSVLLFVFVPLLGSFAALYEGDKCSLQDGSEGKCKLIKECPAAMQLIQTGVNPIICGFEKIDAIVCCKHGEEIMNTTNTTTTTDRTPGDISKQKCEEYAEYAYEKIYSPTLLLKPQFTKKLVCNVQRNKLVVGPILISRSEFPHMALIGYQSNDSVVWKCGGSLISENFVLTAAHCMFPLTPPKYVRLGFIDKPNAGHTQQLTVSEIIPFPQFNNTKSKYHDIGLLRLSKKVRCNTYLRPACLHTQRYIPYDLAVASGWGIVSLFGRDRTKDVLSAVMDVFGVDKCNETYRQHIPSTDTLKDGFVDDLMICAGTKAIVRTTCQYDFGNFLQIYHEETEEIKCMYDIVGITAFSDRCSSENVLEVYTRVSAYIKWIEDIVWPNN